MEKESDAIRIPRLCICASPVTNSPYFSCLPEDKKKCFTLFRAQVPHITEWGNKLTMCVSWWDSHDSNRSWHLIALVPGAFQSCVFMIVAQRVSWAARNYCFFCFFPLASWMGTMQWKRCLKFLKTLRENPKSSDKLFLCCPLVA